MKKKNVSVLMLNPVFVSNNQQTLKGIMEQREKKIKKRMQELATAIRADQMAIWQDGTSL
jgi:hypothetical protein